MLEWIRSVLRPRPPDADLERAQRRHAELSAKVPRVTANVRDVKDAIIADYQRFDGALRRRGVAS